MGIVPKFPAIRAARSRRPTRAAVVAALAGAALLAVACQPGGEQQAAVPRDGQGTPDESVHEFAAAIGQAHGIDAWRSKPAIASDIVVQFGGNVMLEGQMLIEIGQGRSRLELKNGTTLVWDGANAWVNPADAQFPQARFHVLTWPYFLQAPMKLGDPGTNLAVLGAKELRGEACHAAKLTFDPGIGDTPDDWYIVYQDPESGRLRSLAYIVTYGTTAEKAAKEPHAITYDEYVDVEGVTLSAKWTLWLWSEEQGVHGDPLGVATLSNLRFVEPAPDAFAKPADARADSLPPSSD